MFKIELYNSTGFRADTLKTIPVKRLNFSVVSGITKQGDRKVQQIEFESDNWNANTVEKFIDPAKSFIHDIGLELIPDEALEIWLDTYEAAILKGANVEEATGFAWAAVGKNYIKTGENSRWTAFSEASVQEWQAAIESSSNPIIDVFRAGSYPQGVWTEEDIDELVENYDTSIFKAPITLDHSQAGPALGWVSKIFRRGDTLYAILEDMATRFVDKIRSKEYVNRSIEIFTLEHKGVFISPYFKAVTFLGAKVPQVTGLTEPGFQKNKLTLISMDSDKFNSSFSDNIKSGGNSLAKLEFTQAEYDEKMKIANEEAIKAFKLTIKDDTDEAKRKQELADKDSKIVKLEKSVADSKRNEFTIMAEATYERLYAEGKLLPPEKEFFLNFTKLLSADDTAEVEFSESIKGTKVKAFVAFLDQIKARVPKEQRLSTDDPNKDDKTNQRPKKFDGASDVQVARMQHIEELMEAEHKDVKKSTPEWRRAFAECTTKAIEKFPNE